MYGAETECRACFDPIGVGPLICKCKGENSGRYCSVCQQLYFKSMFRKTSTLSHHCTVCKEKFTFATEEEGAKVYRGFTLIMALILPVLSLAVIISLLHTIRTPVMYCALASGFGGGLGILAQIRESCRANVNNFVLVFLYSYVGKTVLKVGIPCDVDILPSCMLTVIVVYTFFVFPFMLVQIKGNSSMRVSVLDSSQNIVDVIQLD
jgi:hypothetical protein